MFLIFNECFFLYNNRRLISKLKPNVDNIVTTNGKYLVKNNNYLLTDSGIGGYIIVSGITYITYQTFQNEQSEKQIFLEYTLNTNTMVASLQRGW